MSAGSKAEAERVALETVLAGAARELAAMSTRAQGLDEAVGDMIDAVAGPGGGVVPGTVLLQEFDLLRQSLDCMHILLRNLSREADGAVTVSRDGVAEGVYLGALRRGCLPD